MVNGRDFFLHLLNITLFSRLSTINNSPSHYPSLYLLPYPRPLLSTAVQSIRASKNAISFSHRQLAYEIKDASLAIKVIPTSSAIADNPKRTIARAKYIPPNSS